MGFLSKLFGGSKPKETCPICGQPMGFFSKTDLTDGAICDKCVARVTPLIGSRLIAEMSVGAVKAVIAEEDEVNAKLVSAFGGEYPNLFKVEYVLPISPKVMKDALAAKGTVVSGAFDKGAVTLIRGGKTIPGDLVETAPFTDNEPVEQTLGAHLYKGAVPAGKTAWLILGGECGAASGDLIGMK